MRANLTKRDARSGQNRTGFRCPDCHHRLTVTHSEATESPLLRKRYYQCSNIKSDCGSTFSGVEEISIRISICPNPNPAVNLPTSKRRQAPLEKKEAQNESDIKATKTTLAR